MDWHWGVHNCIYGLALKGLKPEYAAKISTAFSQLLTSQSYCFQLQKQENGLKPEKCHILTHSGPKKCANSLYS